MVSKFFLVLYLFLFIYSPRLGLPISTFHILSVIAILFLLTKYLDSFFKVLVSPELAKFMILQCFVILYALGNMDYAITTQNFYVIAELLPCAIFISLMCIKCKFFNLNNIYNLILFIGMVQVGFVFVSMISPEFRSWAITNSETEDLENLFIETSLFRLYGFTSGYTFSMPLYQGLCVIIAGALGAFKSSIYYLLIPFFLVSILVNARIALISIFIVLIVIFFIKFRQHPFKQILNVILVSSLICLAGYTIQYYTQNSAEVNAWVWLNEGLEEVIYLIQHGEAAERGNLRSLTDTMWFMPEGLDLLFGTGTNVYRPEIGKNSDIGYVIHINYGGVIFAALLYLSYVLLLTRYHVTNLIDKSIIISIIFFLFIANLKGIAFGPNGLIKGVLVLLIFSIVAKNFQAKKLLNIPDCQSKGLWARERLQLLPGAKSD